MQFGIDIKRYHFQFGIINTPGPDFNIISIKLKREKERTFSPTFHHFNTKMTKHLCARQLLLIYMN